MRQIAVSVLSLFIALPAFAGARMPVVNLAAGGVSARAAFGEPVVSAQNKGAEKNIIATNSDTQKSDNSGVRNVAARSGAAQTVNIAHSKHADTGGTIMANADVLSPRRPSADLWAHSSTGTATPLRLPSPDEFSVIRSDGVLPEESLNSAAPTRIAARTTSNNDVAWTASVSPQASYDVSAPMSELDAQIARLNELQRRANDSVRDDFANMQSDPREITNVAAPRVASRNVVARPAATKTVQKTIASPTIARADDSDDDIKLSRMVVPMNDMTDDVVVRAVKRAESPRITSVREDMTKMSPSELRKAFRKTFLSENKHLSTFQIDDRFDVASDMTANAAGFTSARDLSEAGGIRPLEIKIKFRNYDAALSRDNYTLLTEYAGIVLSNPTRAIQVSIPQKVTVDDDDRKLAARRLAIVEQVLRDNGISEQRILPVLSQRDEDGLVLRMISLDQYETLTKQQQNIFGDTISKKTYRSMSW